MYIDLSDKEVMNKIGIPLWPWAAWFRINLSQDDFDYIVNVIKKDRCFPLILSSYRRTRNYRLNLSMLEIAYNKINVIVFFDKFYNDPRCPKGTKLVLFTLLGTYRDYVAEYHPKLLSERYAYVESWLETVNLQ